VGGNRETLFLIAREKTKEGIERDTIYSHAGDTTIK
jgi:hypothetical protein